MLINDCGWKGGDSGKRVKGEPCLIKRKATEKKLSERKNCLTETGLLMEGDIAHRPALPNAEVLSEIGMFRQLTLLTGDIAKTRSRPSAAH